MESELIQTEDRWRERVQDLQRLLDELQPRLVEAEALLSERMAAISAFEFQVRSRLEPLTRRLDDLQYEIDGLRRQLRSYHHDPLDWEEVPPGDRGAGDQWRFDETSSAAASGAFRYRSQPANAPKTLKPQQRATLKQLYRQLARRFHPDLAYDDADRAYRTDLMMAINAAYAAGDIEWLERLALEPAHVTTASLTTQELAEALEREVERCRRRLLEIDKEMATLERHDSAQLMKRAERAATQGRDLLAELATDLRRRIAEKMIERDVLESQLEEAELECVELSVDDLADIVFNLGLEQAGDDTLFDSNDDWRPKNRSRWDQKGLDDEENTLDDE
jgi:hypothetical protein